MNETILNSNTHDGLLSAAKNRKASRLCPTQMFHGDLSTAWVSAGPAGLLAGVAVTTVQK
jgi:hypothetical protein